ncbi:two-component system sensor histidine kinase NtrB [Pedobacter sp. PWIIR3]
MKLVRVLLIDDDEEDYILTKALFEQLSSFYQLSWVDAYGKGISAMRKCQFDVYLLDYRLGNGTGIELLTEAINSGCEQPIIMLTGKGSSSIDEEAMNTGAADYLVKDELSPSLLERSIRYAIKHSDVLKSLQTSESRYRTIFEKANDPIMVTDHDGVILNMNPGGLNYFGYLPEEVIDHKYSMLFKYPEDAVRFIDLLDQKGILTDFECVLCSKSGEEFHCSLSSFIYTDMKRVSEVSHTMIKDLSYRKGKEQESVHLGKMSVSEHIAGSLGEEVRDPLSTVNLALDELSAEEGIVSNESAQSYIEIIKSNCDKINRVIRNFISSTETKSLNLQMHSIRDVINESLDAAEDLIAGQNVQLSKQLIDTDVVMLLDRPKIKRAILNIVQNAVEATDSYPKYIYISSMIENGIYTIGIEDNGTGIDSDLKSRIFEPFFTTRQRALGLGLTHAQRVVTSHEGNIVVKQLGRGSLFLLQLPLGKEG